MSEVPKANQVPPAPMEISMDSHQDAGKRKEVRKQLHYIEINMATEKQLVTKLREELRKAREVTQLFKEATEAEK